MPVLAIVITLVFATASLSPTGAAGGWFWDFGNGLGFLALAGLLFQMIPYPRSRGARRHERLGYWVLGMALAHGFWFLAGDAAVRVYLHPGAPFYMWAGLGGLLALALLAVLARMPDRMRVHRRFHTFRTAHRGLGLIATALAGLHVLPSGFYLDTWLQGGLLLLIGTGTCFGRRLWSRLPRPPAASSGLYLGFGGAAVLLFVLTRNMGP